MFNLKTTPRFLAILTLSALILTGCAARTTPEAKTPQTPQVGVIDMEKAVRSHPKYQDWQKVKQQAATVQQQLSALASGKNTANLSASNPVGNVSDGLKAAMEQEFNAKMAAKQRELQARLQDKGKKIHSELYDKLNVYAQELDKEYQPQIFNLQLKLQTVRMDEKEAAAVKKAMDDLKAEQANKVAVREKELAQSMETLLAPDKAAIEQDLANYAKTLSNELNAKMAAKTAEIAGQSLQSASPPSVGTGASNLEQQLTAKQQEINVLEESILNDVRDKAAKVAVERNLEAILTGHKVNVNAIDITEAVITAFKK